jgi:hypothetical protein
VWYSYAIVRVVPRVERGEFLNVGVILFAREQEFCAARWRSSEGRPEGGPIAVLQAPERFYWLVAPRSTMIQTSPVHAGRCEEPDHTATSDGAPLLVAALESLLAEFVRLPAVSLRRAAKHSRT